MSTLFFWASKLFWLVFSPASLLVWLLAAAWITGLTRWKYLSRPLLGVAAFFCLLIAYVPLGDWLIYPLEQRFDNRTGLTDDLDGILLLGGSFSLLTTENRQQVHLTDAGERVLAFQELARRHPQAKLVFTGGSGSPARQDIREADIARELFENLGLDSERLIFERDSRNTWENARNTRQLVSPGSDEDWLLITSASHMPRAVGTFCQQGWKVQAYPVDYKTLENRIFYWDLDFISHLARLDDALHEWTGLLAYRVTGRTKRLLPGPRDQCDPQQAVASERL